MPTGIYTKNDRIEQVRAGVGSGKYEYLEDLADSLGLQPRTIMRYALDSDISLPPFRDRNRSYGKVSQNNLMDSLIIHGRYQTLKQVANEFVKRGGALTMSHERVRQYIAARGLQTVFDESRSDYLANQGTVASSLISFGGLPESLNALILDKRVSASAQEAFAYDMAMKKDNDARPSASNLLPFGKVYGLMMDYWEVREDGRNKSLNQFGDDHGIHFVTVGNIFRGLGLPTLGGKKMTKKRVPTPEWKKDLIDRSYDGIMSAADIGHFLQIPAWNVKDRFKTITGSGRNRSNVKTVTGPYGKPVSVRYNTASQVYEARDAGFSDPETRELLKIREKERDWYWKNVGWIGEDIKDTLKFFYRGEEVTKPWVTPNLREFDGNVRSLDAA